METLLIVLFALGAGYALLSLVFGDWLGFDLHPGGLPLLSPTIIATFVTVFGGLGYLLLHETGWPPAAVIGVALIAALGVSTAVLFLVVIPLHAAQKGEAQSAKSMIGLEAEVVTPIEPRRLGEIVYQQGGSRHSAPAKGQGDASLDQGVTVRIVGESAGTFIVEAIDAVTPNTRNE